MAAVHVTIFRPDDDTVTVEINGEEVARATRDEHGWSGMDALVAGVRAVAEATGLDISECGPGED